MSAKKIVKLWKIGRVSYSRGLKVQEAVANLHKNPEINIANILLCLEHTPVYTVGIRGDQYSVEEERVLREKGADFHRTNRGGLITFHGPGQLVVYPILNLNDFKPSMRWYVCQIEKTIIDLCEKFGLKAKTSPHTGVWVNDNKICAIGIHGSRFITTHGLALNCNADLTWFTHIVPCGIVVSNVVKISTKKMAASSSNGIPHVFLPVRLQQVSGLEDKKNDLVYCRPLEMSEKIDVVVFFPGDVQDFSENMASHRDHKRHIQWNLESTAALMHKKFPESHILVVKPSRLELKTFACYDNFVSSNNSGVPEHSLNYKSLLHLESIIQNASQKLVNMTDVELQEAMDVSKNALQLAKHSLNEKNGLKPDLAGYKTKFNRLDLKIIGFSKGCVVLNQFLYAIHTALTSEEKNEDICRFISRIKDMFWLDGGHSGGQNTWITYKLILESLCKTGIKIHIDVTPYQINDDRRPWIKKEEKTFYETLKKLGCNIERNVHFETLEPTLLTHFEVLKTFYIKKRFCLP